MTGGSGALNLILKLLALSVCSPLVTSPGVSLAVPGCATRTHVLLPGETEWMKWQRKKHRGKRPACSPPCTSCACATASASPARRNFTAGSMIMDATADADRKEHEPPG